MGIIGVSAAMLAAENVRAVSRAQEREHQIRSAARLLTAVSLWPRDDLDRHLGSTNQGWMLLRIDRSASTLYSVTVRERSSGRELLRTTLFRTESGP
jgi:hypothetical protein